VPLKVLPSLVPILDRAPLDERHIAVYGRRRRLQVRLCENAVDSQIYPRSNNSSQPNRHAGMTLLYASHFSLSEQSARRLMCAATRNSLGKTRPQNPHRPSSPFPKSVYGGGLLAAAIYFSPPVHVAFESAFNQCVIGKQGNPNPDLAPRRRNLRLCVLHVQSPAPP
jgi:hypothetical protein